MKIEMNFKLKCGVGLDNEAGVHVASCPALDLMSQGESIEETREALASAVTLYLGECYKRGIIEKVLSQRGFAPATGGDSNGEHISIRPSHPYEEFDLNIPFELISQSKSTRVQACQS